MSERSSPNAARMSAEIRRVRLEKRRINPQTGELEIFHVQEVELESSALGGGSIPELTVPRCP
jgi:hypothetical protein